MRAASVALLGTLALIGTACGGKQIDLCGSSPPLERPGTDGDAEARALVLGPADLGGGWRAARAPGARSLLPDLGKGPVTGRAEATLYRRGLVVRTVVIVFTDAAAAGAALANASERSFGTCLADRLEAKGARRVERAGVGAAYMISVRRQAEGGADPVEVAFLQNDRALVLVELVGPFDAPLRERILSRAAA